MTVLQDEVVRLVREGLAAAQDGTRVEVARVVRESLQLTEAANQDRSKYICCHISL